MILKNIKLENGEVFVRIDDLSANESFKILCAIDRINQITLNHSIAVIMPIVAALIGLSLPWLAALIKQDIDLDTVWSSLVGATIGFLIAFFAIRNAVRESNERSIAKIIQVAEYDVGVDFIHQCLWDSPYLKKEFTKNGVDLPLPLRYRSGITLT